MTKSELKSLQTAIREGVRAGLEPFVQRLDAIVARLDATPSPADDIVPETEFDPACTHPDDCRIDFGSMGGEIEWECAVSKGGCGYHYSGASAAQRH